MNTLLAITYGLMLTWMPSHCLMDDTGNQIFKNATHVEYQLGLEVCDILSVYTTEETYQVPDKSVYWQPYRQSYGIGCELHYEFSEKAYLQLGVRHKCIHPVDCWNEKLTNNNEAYTECYLQFSGKFDLLKF